MDPTQKRLILLGPDGGEWYLGERVSVQSLGEEEYLIPKSPPRSMLDMDKFIVVNKPWALDGKPANEFINYDSHLTYEEYRNQCLKPDNNYEVWMMRDVYCIALYLDFSNNSSMVLCLII